MKFLKILWSDIKTICKSKLILAALIAVLILPVMYGGLYLASSWDPYGGTKNLPVAVVNLDQGSEFEDSDVDYGKDVIDKLKNNDDLGWDFVDSVKEAKKGLEGDKYYGMVVIPKDFSEKIVSVKDGNLKKPQFIFMGNKKKNYIVGLIFDKAEDTLSAAVTESAAINFTDLVLDKVYDLRDGLEDGSNGTAMLKEGVTELKDKVPALTNGVDKLYDGAETLTSKLQDAKDGGETLQDGVGTLKGKVPDLMDGINRLYNASENLTSGLDDAYDGSNTLKYGTLELESKIPDLTDGTEKLYSGSESLQEGLGQVGDKMPDLLDGVDKLRDGSSDLRDGLKQAVSSIEDKLGKIEESKDEEKDKEVKKDGNFKQEVITKMVMELKPIIPKLLAKDKLPLIVQGVGGMEKVLEALEPKVPDPMKEQVIKLKMAIGQDTKNMASMENCFKDISQGKNIETSLMTLSKLLVRKDLENDSDTLDLVVKDAAHFQGLVKNFAKANGIDIDTVPIEGLPTDELKLIKQVYDGSKKISYMLPELLKSKQEDFKKLKDGLNMFQLMYIADKYDAGTVDKLGELVSGLTKLYDGSEELYKGLDELYDKSETLSDGLGLLHTGSLDLQDGTDQIKEQVPALSNAMGMLSDGTRDLSAGIFKLNKGSETFTENMGDLRDQAPDLEEGVNELYDGTFDLTDGIGKLKDGSVKLEDGLETLKDKMPDLQDGADELYEGVAYLGDKLSDGAKRVADLLVNSSKQVGEFVGNPVDVDDTPLYEVSSYGVGLAPYFMSLALWVGALLMFFVISEKTPRALGAGRTTVILSKYFAYCVLGAIQAVCISIFVMKLGLKPTNVPMYFAFNVFLSFVFVAIAQNLVFIFGDAGKALMIVALLLQLTSSGGTFPKELLPSFFQKLNPYMPFTHSLIAMKEINSGINMPVFKKEIKILFMILVGFLLATILLKRVADKIFGSAEIEKEKDRALAEVEKDIELKEKEKQNNDTNNKLNM